MLDFKFSLHCMSVEVYPASVWTLWVMTVECCADYMADPTPRLSFANRHESNKRLLQRLQVSESVKFLADSKYSESKSLFGHGSKSRSTQRSENTAPLRIRIEVKLQGGQARCRPRFSDYFGDKLLLVYATSLGCFTAVVLPASTAELVTKIVIKPRSTTCLATL